MGTSESVVVLLPPASSSLGPGIDPSISLFSHHWPSQISRLWRIISSKFGSFIPGCRCFIQERHYGSEDSCNTVLCKLEPAQESPESLLKYPGGAQSNHRLLLGELLHSKCETHIDATRLDTRWFVRVLLAAILYLCKHRYWLT